MRTVSITRKSSGEKSAQEFKVQPDEVLRISRRLAETEALRAQRESALQALKQMARPARHDEAWRRTDPERFPWGQVTPGPAETWPVGTDLLGELQQGPAAGWLVVHPGHESSAWISPALKEAGVVFSDWKTAVRDHSTVLERYLGSVLPPANDWFTALAATLAEDGVLVYVPAGVQVQQPLRSLLWAPGAGRAFFTRSLVILEEGASLTFEHEYHSPTEAEGSALHSGILEVLAGKGAQLDVSTVQNWGEHVWDVTHRRIRVEESARVTWNSAVFGSQTSKEFSELELAGEGAEGRWAGVYFANGEQHFDMDTQQNHLSPHTTSDLLYKGALTGKARSVWQGMINVEREAQQTDGYQANRNLILSSKARADSIPGLEIKADDVRCTHGATAGDVDEEQVYYLMSRGIPRPEARKLVVEGFFSPVLQRIANERLRYRLNAVIDDKMEQ